MFHQQGAFLVNGTEDHSRGRGGVLEGSEATTRNVDLGRANLADSTQYGGANGVVANVGRGPSRGGKAAATSTIVEGAQRRIEQQDEKVKRGSIGQGARPGEGCG